MTKETYVAQAQLYVDGEWQNRVAKPPELLTFQQYVVQGGINSTTSKEDDEIFCPVCKYSGKEQLLLDGGVRIYHRSRLTPCRAPEGYAPVQCAADQLVSA